MSMNPAELQNRLAKASAPFAAYPEPTRRVVQGREMLSDHRKKPPELLVRDPYTKKLETGPRVMAVLKDGRFRPIEQIVRQANVKKDTAMRFLLAQGAKGDVEVAIVAGNWLYGLTQKFGG